MSRVYGWGINKFGEVNGVCGSAVLTPSQFVLNNYLKKNERIVKVDCGTNLTLFLSGNFMVVTSRSRKDLLSWEEWER